MLTTSFYGMQGNGEWWSFFREREAGDGFAGLEHEEHRGYMDR